MAIEHKRSPDEPEGGWMSPGGPQGWPDLEELNRKQLETAMADLSRKSRLTRSEQKQLDYCRRELA
jgi:hypothetical protein